MCPWKCRVHLDDLLELLYGLATPAGDAETDTFVKVGAVRGRVEVDSMLYLGQCVVILAHHHQTSAVPRECLRIFWIELHRAFKLTLGGRPVVVQHVLVSKRGMSLRERRVDRKCAANILLFQGTVPVLVAVGETDVAESELRI